jgi:branched-chain amino acid transport system substrate-binding protein
VNAGEGLRVHGAGARAPVRLVYYDDASSPARAAVNAERLLDADAVEVLIGPYASDLTRAVLPVAGRRGRVLWNHGGASDDIHMGGGRAVGILTPVSRYFGGLIELTRSLDPDAARVALLHRGVLRTGAPDISELRARRRRRSLRATEPWRRQ